MNKSECKTTAETYVLDTYRRIRRRKDMTDFYAVGLALAEEIKYGAVLSPAFVETFSSGTRTLTPEGKVVLTECGRKQLLDLATSEVSTVERTNQP